MSTRSGKSSSEIDSSSDVGTELKAKKFYATCKYVPPLERPKLKRKTLSPLSSDSGNSPSVSKTKKKAKLSKGKNTLAKENKKPHSSRSKKVASTKETHINPAAFLSKKESDGSNSKNKFFKTRSPDSLREKFEVNLTRQKIVPVNTKGAKLSNELIKHSSSCGSSNKSVAPQSKFSNDTSEKEHVSTITSRTERTENSVRRKSKWVLDSFAEPSASMKVVQSSKLATQDPVVFSEDSPSDDHSEKINSSGKLEAKEKSLSLKKSRGVSKSVSTPSTEGVETSGKKEVHPPSELELQTENGHKEEKEVYSVFQPTTVQKTKKQVKKSSALPKSSKKLKAAVHDEENQLMIDAGQKEIGAKVCPTCCMVYHVGNVADENLHTKFHETYLASLKFQGWKKERVVGQFFDGRVIMVTDKDPRFMLKKVEEVLGVVNRELGISHSLMPTRPDPAFLLFISLDGKIVGFLVAESISYGYRAQLDKNKNCLIVPAEKDGSEKVKAICGVNRLWVSAEYQRTGIATRMMDCLRCNYLYGYPIPIKQLAFLDPSADGVKFLSRYCKNEDILVYK